MLSELIHKKFINRPAGEKLILLMTVFIFLPFFPAAILSCFAFFYILQDRNRRKAVFSAPYGFLLPLYGLLLLLSAYFNNNVEGFACSVVLNFYFIFALYSKNLANPDLANDVFDVSCLMSILCFAVSVPDYFLKYHARVSAFFYNPNFYGFIIELIILLCFYRYFTCERYKPLYVAIIALNFAALLLTDCRSAWPALLVGMLIVFILMKKLRNLVVLAVTSCVFTVLVYNIPFIIPRAFQFERSSAIRIDIWHRAFQDFLCHPLFGQGMLAFLKASGDFITPHAHNILIDTLECSGIIGFAMIGFYFVVLVVQAIRPYKHGTPQQKSMAALMAGILGVVLVHGITDVPYVGGQTGIFMMLLLSMREAYKNPAEKASALQEPSISQRQSGIKTHE